MAASDLMVGIGVDLKELTDGFKKASSQMEAFGDKMSNIGQKMSLAITAPLLLAGRQMIKLASDSQEATNKVEVAFGKSADAVKEFASTSLTQFGIAKGSAMDMASTYGDMSTSMGLTQQQAAGLSTSLVGLAADLASFKNIGIDQANTALKGIFTGETESLKTLGIVMTDANLKAYALAKGFKGNTEELTQGEKVLLRYNYVLDNTKNSQGDFARTGGGAANQMRIFGESLKEIGDTFGTIVLPSFTKGITYVNNLMKEFAKLDSETKKNIIIGAIFVAAIGPTLVAISSIITAVKTIGLAFMGINAPIIAVIALVAAFAYGASENFSTLKTNLNILNREFYNFEVTMVRLLRLINGNEWTNNRLMQLQDELVKRSDKINNIGFGKGVESFVAGVKKANAGMSGLLDFTGKTGGGSSGKQKSGISQAKEEVDRLTEALKELDTQQKITNIQSIYEDIFRLQGRGISGEVKPISFTMSRTEDMAKGDKDLINQLFGEDLEASAKRLTDRLDKIKANIKPNIEEFTTDLGKWISKNFEVLKGVTSQMVGGLADILASGLGNMFNQDVKFDPKKMIGQILESVGQMLIGIAAPLVAALALGNVATMGGMSVQWGAALGMLGAGIAMKGGGMALSSSESSSSYTTGARNATPYQGERYGSMQTVEVRFANGALNGYLDNRNKKYNG